MDHGVNGCRHAVYQRGIADIALDEFEAFRRQPREGLDVPRIGEFVQGRDMEA